MSARDDHPTLDERARIPPPEEDDIMGVGGQMSGARIAFAWWRFLHNAVIHPMLAFPWAPKWAERAHDWTAIKIPGAG